MIRTWPCPLPDGSISEELVLGDGPDGETRILIIPPLFDEHNKLRRQLVEVMRRFAEAAIDTRLPDLPGWNESKVPLDQQTLSTWQAAMAEAAQHFEISHVIAVRSGALLAPERVKGWFYAPQSGAKLLRGMIRARLIASREAGRSETSEALYAMGREHGLTLAGWSIGPQMFGELEAADIQPHDNHVELDQSLIGGQGLWLRAEPGEDAAQADALVTAILEDLGKPE